MILFEKSILLGAALLWRQTIHARHAPRPRAKTSMSTPSGMRSFSISLHVASSSPAAPRGAASASRGAHETRNSSAPGMDTLDHTQLAAWHAASSAAAAHAVERWHVRLRAPMAQPGTLSHWLALTVGHTLRWHDAPFHMHVSRPTHDASFVRAGHSSGAHAGTSEASKSQPCGHTPVVAYVRHLSAETHLPLVYSQPLAMQSDLDAKPQTRDMHVPSVDARHAGSALQLSTWAPYLVHATSTHWLATTLQPVRAVHEVASAGSDVHGSCLLTTHVCSAASKKQLPALLHASSVVAAAHGVGWHWLPVIWHLGSVLHDAASV
mmetsp:Transcript_36552/g.112616  ORF Transcript_36552/g.112616 Transcript_36552/m.112616 type:complete len:322 (-) Transcript_36552:6170-7135(-)